MRIAHGCRETAGRLVLVVMLLVAGLPATGAASASPRYDVPHGYTRCPTAMAWNGFFKWASVKRTTCRRAARFMRAYADKAGGKAMPRHIRAFHCRIRYWRNADDDIYASRHACQRGDAIIRFYGMV